MADEFMGRVIESHGDAGIEAKLPHQNENRKDRIPVICYDFKHISREEVDRGMKAVQIGKTDKADQRHGKAQLDTR